jgi:hypothetical protein
LLQSALLMWHCSILCVFTIFQFNQKTANEENYDEALLAPCYKDPSKCSVTLTCDEHGKWTTKSAKGTTAVVDTMFCD